MIPWLLLLPLPLSVLAGVDKTFGVRPDLVPKYTPLSNGNWKCLDGSKEIPWAFVNDDSCDCPDGSDEPGTGACPNTVFYCRNKGHIGATIPSSRVKDGLCEPDCCDGSDERPGVCTNRCKEIGEEYKKKRDAERKTQKTGAKIRSTYIAFAHKEKKRLEVLLENTSQSIEAQEKEVARLKDVADRTESMSQAALEHKQASPLYTSLLEHSAALKALQQEYKKHLEREKALGDILNTLRSGYNPNYQDMAVLEAVRGWEELAKLPHINDVGKDSTTEEANENQGTTNSAESKEEEEEDEDAWTPEKLEKDLDTLLNVDHVSLLLAHDEHVQTPHEEPSLLFDLTSYLPDSILPQYEEFKAKLVGVLRTLGIVHGPNSGSSADSSRARQAFNDAETLLNNLKEEKKKAVEDLGDIFDPEGFGTEGEWKKLEGLCLEKEHGDYTYELCFFDEARQKPKSGGTTFSLGRFDSWNPSPDLKPGEPEYYEKQMYKRGTRCWNGPERSVILLLTCGTENALLSVQELEKCEYQFTGTTPALCLPLKDEKGSNKDEL